MAELTRWWDATSLATGLAAMTVLLSLWVVYQELHDRQLIWEVGCIIGVLGLVGIFVSIHDRLAAHVPANATAEEIGGLTKSEETLQSEIAALRTRAEGAEQQLAAMQERAASRTDLLTPKVRADLLRRLRQLPPASVELCVEQGAHDAALFAEGLRPILIEAGCFGREYTVVLAGGTPHGVQVVHVGTEDEPNPSAQAMFDALVEAGIPNVTLERGAVDARAIAPLVKVTIRAR